MKTLILRIYDYFAIHRGVMTIVLLIATILLAFLVTHVDYKEEITDFLPLDGNRREAMQMYQNLSGANRIIAIVGMKDSAQTDPDKIVEAVDAFADVASRQKLRTTSSVDFEKISEVTDFVYSNIPYFLTDRDYQRIDSLLDTPNYTERQLLADRQQALLPTGGMLSANLGKDPLNLFTPVVEKLNSQSLNFNYELYGGHIFTPDMKAGIVMIDSPYGSSETEQNGKLIEQLNKMKRKVENEYKGIRITLTGGPVIAVGNARQIKSDSLLTISIAVVLILVLLFFSFRSWRNIFLIILTIGWGWLFALGCLSLVHSDISLIVIGISSVIIGIAVNYPLHLVAHLNHTPDIRQALREIIGPLLVGNVTTIGAFLALVPLRAVALRDLGLFASFLLIGTILFVFAFLPHLVKSHDKAEQRVSISVGDFKLENKRWLIFAVAILTIVFGFFSLRTSFDPDFSHINFMTKEQKTVMNYLSSFLRTNSNEKTVYVVSKGKSFDEALARNEATNKSLTSTDLRNDIKSVNATTRFLVSKEEQRLRLERWRQFTSKFSKQITQELSLTGNKNGFTDDSFNDFYTLLSKHYTPKEAKYFDILIEGTMKQHLYENPENGYYAVLTPLTVKADKVEKTINDINTVIRNFGSYCFEIGQLNAGIARSLSDNFNYIGWACGLIVFLFLWLSMGNIELAALSFLPMALSWIWILGIMSIFGIQFNIINIILATFIFGQGDDYTIFMTEGCQYEYAYGRKMLASYKNSIIISALIMFIGMGVLIIAHHPALRSLGAVTLVGMSSVVLMAYLIPPFVFKWIVSKNGKLRKRPLTIKSLLMPKRYPQDPGTNLPEEAYKRYVKDVYYYCGTDIVGQVKSNLDHNRDYILSENDNTIEVSDKSYGAVALLTALRNPHKTVIVDTAGEHADVCRNVACRIAENIRMR